MKTYALAAAAAAMLSILVSCGDAGSGMITADGSSTVAPISEAMAEEFQAINSGVRVTVGTSGTGGGFKKFLNKETDISNASRPIKDSELELAEKNAVTYVELPIAYDGLTVVENPQNTWVDNLTIEELHKIFAPDSRITKWSEVRAGWPAEPLKIFSPGRAPGRFAAFPGPAQEAAERPGRDGGASSA